jgi:predicted kinase
MPDDRPLLLIVGGAPASGKTTLAERLARELRLPLLARDALKERLMDSLGSPNRTRSRELGAASYALLFAMLDTLLEAEVGAILESNFSRGLSEAELRGPVSRCRAVQLHCRVSPELSRSRYIARAESGSRHPGHHDAAAETLANLDQALSERRHEPLDLAIPFLSVNTTDGYDPDFPAILAFIERAQPTVSQSR